jgi:hypothetical protein
MSKGGCAWIGYWSGDHVDEIDEADVGVGRAGARASLIGYVVTPPFVIEQAVTLLGFGLKVKRS